MCHVWYLVINYWILIAHVQSFYRNTQYGFRWPQIGSMALAGAGPTASTWRLRAGEIQGRYYTRPRRDMGDTGEI